jgi:hypothetical protein
LVPNSLVKWHSLLTNVNTCNLVEVHIAKAQTPLYQYTIETKKKGDIYNLLGILDGVWLLTTSCEN